MGDSMPSGGFEPGLQKLLGQVSEAALLLNPHGVVLYSNQRRSGWLGRAPFTGAPMEHVVADFDQAGYAEFLRQTRRHEASCTLALLDARHAPVCIHLRGSPVHHGGQAAVAVVAHKAPAMLAPLPGGQLPWLDQGHYRSFLESNIVGIGITCADGRILECNDYYLNLLGGTRRQLEAGLLDWREHTPQAELQWDLLAGAELEATGKCMPYQKHYRHASGVLVPVLIALSYMPQRPGETLVFVLDISPLKQVEQQHKQTNQALQQRSAEAEAASAEKTRFLSTISHELRTPLHTILGHVGLLRKHSSVPLGLQLQVVENSATSLLGLIDELLDFNIDARQNEALQLDWMELAYLRCALQEFGQVAAAKADNQFSVVIAPAVPAQIRVDERRLLQVLRNLVGNACKYTQRGQVMVRLERLAPAQADSEQARQTIHFSVQDTGRGIAPQDLPRIFEPLYRSADALDQPGTGLGLAIARQWVRNMGGDIQVQSEPGRGCVFQFAL